MDAPQQTTDELKQADDQQLESSSLPVGFIVNNKQSGMVPMSYQLHGSGHMMSVDGTNMPNYIGAVYDDDMRTEQHHQSDNYNRMLFQSQHISNNQPDDNSSIHSSQIINIRKVKLSDTYSILQNNKRKNRKVNGTTYGAPQVSSDARLPSKPKKNYNKQHSVQAQTSIRQSEQSVLQNQKPEEQKAEQPISASPEAETEAVDQFVEYEHVYKIIMIGTSATGKTSLIYRFISDQFNQSYLNTVGIDLKVVTLEINNTLVRVNIWDTTGQEKFNAMTKSYYRNCQGAVAVFDLTKRDTFYGLEASIKEFRNNCPPEAIDNIVLVGNKVDLVEQRQVTLEEANNLVKRLNLLSYLETSAQQNVNVDAFFYTVAMKAFETETQTAVNQQDQFFDNMSQKGPNRRITSNAIQLDRYVSDGQELKKKKKRNCKC